LRWPSRIGGKIRHNAPAAISVYGWYEASDEAKAKIVDFEKRGEEILASIPRQF
jgi:hypothetical protein